MVWVSLLHHGKSNKVVVTGMLTLVYLPSSVVTWRTRQWYDLVIRPCDVTQACLTATKTTWEVEDYSSKMADRGDISDEDQEVDIESDVSTICYLIFSF